MGMQLIETIEVGSGGAASIEFTSIPQDGVDLLVVASVRESSYNDGFLGLRLNGSSTIGDYAYVYLYGDGSSASTSSAGSTTLIYGKGGTNPSNATANTFSNYQVLISNYTSSASKSVSIDTVTENNGSTAFQGLSAGKFVPTSAITSVTLLYQNLVQYSTASLYKITAD